MKAVEWGIVISLLCRMEAASSGRQNGMKRVWEEEWIFEEVYDDRKGCAYALTYVDSKEGEPYTLELAASGRLRVFVDNENIYESADGN